MSLLDRLGRGHLDDSEFARLWTSEAGHPHLDACAPCRARYEAFGRWLSGIGDELRLEAEEAVPENRLAIQQAQIARRLETLERPTRVIPFPKAARAVISGHSHVRRWVTVAAAALIAGFGLGQVMPLRTVVRPSSIAQVQPQFTAPDAEQRAKQIPPVTSSNSSNDDELLSETFTQSRVSSLNALDEMTPHARDQR